LCSPDVIFLSLGFFSQKFFKFGTRLSCFSVITLLFTLAAVFFE
jgi:hypothetical protein